MKTAVSKQWTIMLALAGVLTVCSAAANYGAPPFYDALSPHGNWIAWQGDVQVWQPAVAMRQPDWRPYYHDGHWVWSGRDWQWRSLHPWGPVVFHYGQWWQAPGMGWVWVPGTVYASAWVEWRYSGNTWGWAPLPPPAYLHAPLQSGYVRLTGRRFSLSFSLAPSHYVFVPLTAFGAQNLSHAGYCGSSTQIQFSTMRTVSVGPSPHRVGGYRRATTQTVYAAPQQYVAHPPRHSPVVVAPVRPRHVPPVAAAPSRSSRHGGASTWSSRPAPRAQPPAQSRSRVTPPAPAPRASAPAQSRSRVTQPAPEPASRPAPAAAAPANLPRRMQAAINATRR